MCFVKQLCCYTHLVRISDDEEAMLPVDYETAASSQLLLAELNVLRRKHETLVRAYEHNDERERAQSYQSVLEQRRDVVGKRCRHEHPAADAWR